MKKLFSATALIVIIAGIYFGYRFIFIPGGGRDKAIVSQPPPVTVQVPPAKPNPPPGGPPAIQPTKPVPPPPMQKPASPPPVAVLPPPPTIGVPPPVQVSVPVLTVINDTNGVRSTFIQKLTGENEAIYNASSGMCSVAPTVNQTEKSVGLRGTDLGTSFEYQGKTWFLFGDTIQSLANKKPYPVCSDSIAYMSGTGGGEKIKLSFLTNGGAWLPITVSGSTLGCFDVPLDGVAGADGATMYAWFSDDNGVPGTQNVRFYKSYLAKTVNPSQPFTKVYDWSFHNDCYTPEYGVTPGCTKLGGKFTYVSAEIDGSTLYIVGGGGYRKSDAYLAQVPLQSIEDKSKISYFAGMDNSNQPIWSANESASARIIDTTGNPASLISDGCVGEISLTKNKVFGKWLLLYNCANKIIGHIANNPWGPWSAAQTIFDPNQDKGYCTFMYQGGSESGGASSCACLNDGINKTKSGGVYGPYAVDALTKSDGQGGAYIYYLMSTWNPYNTVLMKTHIRAN